MEKIYEEKSYSQKSSKMGVSVALSFVVAAFAIVSLIVVGFDQISYAANPSDPEVKLKLLWYPDADFDGVEEPAFVKTDKGGHEYRMLSVDVTVDGTTTNYPSFCIEAGKTTSDGESYEQNSSSTNDPGINYILNHSNLMNSNSSIIPTDSTYPEGSPDDYKSGTLEAEDYKALEYYATQVAIWVYQYDEYGGTGSMNAQEYEDIKTGSNIYSKRDLYQQRLATGPIYSTYIAPVVEAAKTATDAKGLELVLESEDVQKLENDTIYQAGPFSVLATPSGDLNQYYVTLSGDLGRDAYVVDPNGNKIDYVDPLRPTDKFYVQIPTSKLSEEKKSVHVEVSGEFKNYNQGNYYLAAGGTGHQSIVVTSQTNPRAGDARNVYFMLAPDTGMSTAQTIYFVGLIVLLCGVGIIYANAKPVEEK